MSVPPQSGNPGARAMSVGNGPPSAGIPQNHQMQPQQPQVAPAAGAASGQQSQQNLNQIVLEYLSKKGYTRTEAMLRKESKNHDAEGRPVATRAEEKGGAKYRIAFENLRQFVDNSLDLYKPELRKLLWPVFVYSFLNLVDEHYAKDAGDYFKQFQDMFSRDHGEDLRHLSPIRDPQHTQENETAQIYRNHKYNLNISNMAFHSLIEALENVEEWGGALIVTIIHTHMRLNTYDRSVREQSMQNIGSRSNLDEDLLDEDEGIPGHKPGHATTDSTQKSQLAKLKLGPFPPDQELQEDVRADLQDEDAKVPPRPGQNSLVDEYDQLIKKEPTDDMPSRDMVPLPPPLARDVEMEKQKVREHRDRFRLTGRSGGIGPGVSVTMYTFHNTFGSVCCIDFSGDNKLVAIGTSESYIRIWSMDGSALPSVVPHNPADPSTAPSSSKRLYGHAGPVYNVAFSPSTEQPNTSSPATGSKYLLSCSADKTIRLWSTETWTNVVVYRSHDNPVWDLAWGPYGHYFLTGSHDRTARLWTTNSIEPHKFYVGHLEDVDCVAFHPNNLYVFTGSSDKTVRMWHINNGTALRLFTSHTEPVCAISCSPDGRTLASADFAGNIILWDLESGRRKKRMRGHGPGGIWSMSWSVESSVLVSGGADGTVRVWDALQETSESGKIIAEGGAGTKIDGSGAGGAGGAASGKKARGGKDVVITPDQISAFPTKKSPVYKVMFTRMNLVLAGGAYLP